MIIIFNFFSSTFESELFAKIQDSRISSNIYSWFLLSQCRQLRRKDHFRVWRESKLTSDVTCQRTDWIISVCWVLREKLPILSKMRRKKYLTYFWRRKIADLIWHSDHLRMTWSVRRNTCLMFCCFLSMYLTILVYRLFLLKMIAWGGLSVRNVCVIVYCAKTAEWIEVPFWGRLMGARHVLKGGPDLLQEGVRGRGLVQFNGYRIGKLGQISDTA